MIITTATRTTTTTTTNITTTIIIVIENISNKTVAEQKMTRTFHGVRVNYFKNKKKSKSDGSG